MRYRLRWARRNKLRFLSHHDEALVLERSARRAGLPLAYSKGFTPHPKISFGSGLPVGFGSEVELLDLTLTEPLAPVEVVDTFNNGLPKDLRILGAAPLPPGAPSLGKLLHAADYEIEAEAPWIEEALRRFLALDTFPIVRIHKGRERIDDLRAGVIEAGFGVGIVSMRCRLAPRAARPTDVVAAMAKMMEEPVPAADHRRTGLLTEMGDGYQMLDEMSGSGVAA